MRFGVNYVPSKNWWYTWSDWDAGSVRRDFESIASIGLDHVRIHCLWPEFQPNAGFVSPVMLERLSVLLDIAGACGLDVAVTVLDGWLSGFVFLPAWVGARNMFTDEAVIEAEMRLFSALAEQIGSHPRFLGFDLGNELGVMMGRGHTATPEQADAWQHRMFAHCYAVSPGRMHVNGVDHIHWFDNVGFTPQALACEGALTSLHTWYEFTGARARYAPLETGSTRLSEYCIELARAYHTDPRRLLWVQEFGATPEWMPAEVVSEFAERTIDGIAGCPDVWGVTWWCSHEIDRRFLDFHDLEYNLGLFDVDNEIMPVGRKMAEIIADHKANLRSAKRRTHAVVVPDSRADWALQADGSYPGWTYGALFMELAAGGIDSAVVTEGRASDPDYLASRGLAHLHRTPSAK
jgi:hypothetical protein